MRPDTRDISKSFDARAASYNRNDWHRRSADRLVSLCPLKEGDRVLDAATGTGFAALAAARVVGNTGYVCGVDISAGMLAEAEAARMASGLTTVEFAQADATSLSRYPAGTFDVVTCATGLLYIPVALAMAEWHRLLKKGGVVAFSTMQAGSPRRAQIFRDCAAAFGISLHDPNASLGSSTACRRALEESGFEVVAIVGEPIEFSAQDLAVSWESSFHSYAARHPEIRTLDDKDQRAFQASFMAAIAEASPNLNRADMLYAVGRRR